MTNILNGGDSVTQSLGKLYRSLGYSRYKMSKFEEYDTYASNKDFLISDRVITFTDVSGKLLAMKPDVTISIIKNTDDDLGKIHKMYYKENVYRVSPASHGFKEIMQMGLECIGAVDTYSLCEVIILAAKSLNEISSNFCLDISHMGFVSAVLSEAGFNSSEKANVLCAIGEKNLPLLNSICEEKSLSTNIKNAIFALINIYGSIETVTPKLQKLCINEEAKKSLEELESLCDAIKCTNLSGKVQIDFSVVNDMNYYNGLVFRGYIEGIPTGVLSGGQYDKLMAKMGKKSKAVGFALYLDLLERLDTGKKEYDADVVIAYNSQTKPSKVFSEAQKQIEAGKTVLCLKNIPEDIRYITKIDFTKGDAENENC